MKIENREPAFFNRSRWMSWFVVLGLFLGGVGLRIINLTNPPLDFHAWRQLRSATIARGLFFQWSPSADPQLRDLAITLGKGFEVLEPNIFESLVALIYVIIGHEVLWVARVLAIIFWTVGGMGVFALARRMTSLDGACVALAAYLFMPYGVMASRSFQPDVLMTMWIIWSAFCFYRWAEEHTWKWAVITGICSGMAILTKVFAVYPVVMVALWVVLSTWAVKKLLKDAQTWVIAALMVIIPSLYYVFQVGNLASGYLSGWVAAFSGLLLKPQFYIRWLNFLHYLVDLTPFFIGLGAVMLLPKRGRAVMLGLWMGYALIGMSVPSLIITHDYYNLSLIPIIALSLALVGQVFLSRISQQPKIWQAVCVVVMLVAIAYASWLKRNDLVANDFRPEVMGWIKMGRELPRNAKIIGITHDYGTRLQYYGWYSVAHWPYAMDQQMNVLAGGNSDMNDPVWNDIFAQKTEGFDYFLVDNFDELKAQPVLEKILAQYPIIEKEGYRLYDLRP